MNSNAENPSPLIWDGSEPVTDAIDRFGLRHLFDLAIQANMRTQAVDLLTAVGVPQVKAVMIIDGVLTADGADQ